MTVIAVASDHVGFQLKETVKDHLRRRGLQVLDFGCDGPESVDWPEVIYPAAASVSDGEAEIGILMDGAGFSAGMIANRLPGLRAAVCWNVQTAQLARAHTNANVLCIGGGMLETAAAVEVVESFLSTDFEDKPRYARRLAQLEALSRRLSGPVRGAGGGDGRPGRTVVTAEDIVRAASMGRIYEPTPDEMLTPEAQDLLERIRSNLKTTP